jgi:hypothetical protein
MWRIKITELIKVDANEETFTKVVYKGEKGDLVETVEGA